MTQAVAQSSKEQVTLAQQLSSTSELVARLMADSRREDARDGGIVHERDLNGPQNGGQNSHTNRSTIGCNRMDEETLLHRSALPKLSFPKSYGENHRIWFDKCADYFHIFNIPETMWTTTASLHMEDNIAKWLQVHKIKHDIGSWPAFVAAVEPKFGCMTIVSRFRTCCKLSKMT
jgi:hypothetical protein